MKNVSLPLKAYLKEKKITQKEIAEKLGTSQPYVAQLLKQAIFSRQMAEKWQDLFGINAAWLLTGEGEMLAETSAKIQNFFDIDASGNKIETRGENSPALGRGAVLTTDSAILQAENASLRSQLQAKDDQIAALHKIIEKLTS